MVLSQHSSSACSEVSFQGTSPSPRLHFCHLACNFKFSKKCACIWLSKRYACITQVSFFHLRNISKLQAIIFSELEKIVHVFVSLRLHYSNALFTGLDQSFLSRLQAIQNAAARLLMHSGKWSYITLVLSSLHWLPVDFRICFKILTLPYRALNGKAPDYISQNLLFVPHTRLKNRGGRVFQSVAPRLWNSLSLWNLFWKEYC